MMMSMVLAMALSMAPAKADPVDNARKGFNNCLIEIHNKAVDDKQSPSGFKESLGAACTAEKTAYRDLIIKAERGYGSKQSEAEKFADEEVQTIVDYVISAFSENVESRARMSPEK
jgi:hypothetical protein